MSTRATMEHERKMLYRAHAVIGNEDVGAALLASIARIDAILALSDVALSDCADAMAAHAEWHGAYGRGEDADAMRAIADMFGGES